MSGWSEGSSGARVPIRMNRLSLIAQSVVACSAANAPFGQGGRQHTEEDQMQLCLDAYDAADGTPMSGSGT
jgi:hypothetical protein